MYSKIKKPKKPKKDIRIQLLTDYITYKTIERIMQEYNLNSSQAVNVIIKRYEDQDTRETQAATKLNKVIQAMNDKIENLQYELAQVKNYRDNYKVPEETKGGVSKND